jgi:hypothetical protein
MPFKRPYGFCSDQQQTQLTNYELGPREKAAEFVLGPGRFDATAWGRTEDQML